MSKHAQAPAVGMEPCALATPRRSIVLYVPFKSRHVARTQHLSLAQHAAYVALETLIRRYGVRPVLDNADLVCRTLGCSRRHWQNVLGPVIVPLLDVDLEEVA